MGGLWLLLRSAGLGRGAAVVGTGTAAFSYAFWRNAVDVEVYALSALALVGCLAAAWSAARAPSARTFGILGAANGIAVLAHVTNVLFAFAAGAAVWLGARAARRSLASTWRWSGAYAASAAAVVVPAYAVAAVLHGLGSPAEFWRWFTERAGQPGDFGQLDASSLPGAAFGSARALVGGHFALSVEPIRDALTSRFAGKTFAEERFFLEGFPDGLAVALLVLAVVAGALVAATAASWLRRPRLDPARRTLAILAAAWLVPYAVFFLWWEPLNIELWYAAWLAAGVLLALASDERPWVLAGLAAVSAIFAVNLAGSMLPQHDDSRDYWRAKTAWYRAHTRPDDLVVSNGYIWSAYLRYLLDAEVVDVEDLFREAETEREALADLRRRVSSAPGRVLVSGETFVPFADRRSACLDAPRTCAIAAATARELRRHCEVLAVAREPLERVWRCARTA